MKTNWPGFVTQSLILLILCNWVNCKRAKLDRNVLIIVGDDAGFESSVYGNEAIETPGQQSLADNGVTFDNAFTAVSSCSPSRASILSGLPPHQNGMYGLHQGRNHFNSFDRVRSLPNILRKHGIKTGIVGKKHVGPESVYSFDFSQTEENNPTNQIGRNITNMNRLVGKFLDGVGDKNFFLYIGFHDPHRCRTGNYGGFCQNFGNGMPGMGKIPDWKPVYYSPDKVKVPYFVPNTPAARQDIAAQYTVINRMDQGIELFIKQLHSRSLLNKTLVLFTSDNGIPFPSGRTNLYDPGMKEPFIISSPFHKSSWGSRNSQLVSLLDIVPTVLDFFNISYPKHRIFHNSPPVSLTGRSVLPLFEGKGSEIRQIFASHNLHEISMYYPMRLIRSHRYKLIRNLNFLMPFPIDQDFYVSLTFRDILNRSIEQRETHWYKDIDGYYYRSQYELYDLREDFKELNNLAKLPAYKHVLDKLKFKLHHWMNATNDPWLCAPSKVMETVAQGYNKWQQCFPLYNDL